MVVVSGSWVKNVVPYSTQITERIELLENETMAAKAILICRPNSHLFQERVLTLDQPIKVGRSVARIKPTSNNAIFDCKVLSRHHALLWYEDGKFYLQDTKSSNGTFVNNTKLFTDSHEMCSGDIVQFGVDVMENRKVTHGCIIATIKLFLPDGSEAKASPSITEGDSHVPSVPLDDLYRLQQIIQEATQREQCLESKLNALRNVVEETKRSAEESWQAYVGEERLLSRISALEIQLHQARSNWSEDKLKEEIVRLRENNEKYQEAAKETLEKVHGEKQRALAQAIELEGAKISAEQDAILAKQQLDVAQVEIQELAQKLSELQTKAEEEKREHEKHVRELEQQMEEEEAKIIELEAKIYELTVEMSKKYSERWLQQNQLIENDLKTKEDILAENEMTEELLNKSNGFEPNHISLTVAPVEEKVKTEDSERESSIKHDESDELSDKEEGKRVSFNLPENANECQEDSQNGFPTNEVVENQDESPEPDSNFLKNEVDSKTLKHQFQSAQREQMELKRKIQILEKNSEFNKSTILELNKALCDERQLSEERQAACDTLKEELRVLNQRWEDSNGKNLRLIARVNDLVKELDKQKEQLLLAGSNASKETEEEEEETVVENNEIVQEEEEEGKIEELNSSNMSVVSTEQLLNIEEELVLLKEKYAQSCEEKMRLQRDLVKIKIQYEMVCDSMYNKYFWYVAPLVIIVLYLLIREWIS
ncbi:sarcolemmal membrane-associated protein [Anthonomus grandis grandis]|uniref:sarcolemmal membrane-associated protein n=1 Tax=Anthonomus grandis grandis TaxID=2921223 RepID=UPI0021652B1D|nr:sarcolemmal membrane-associated protein [Anthonomus grandis grandis]